MFIIIIPVVHWDLVIIKNNPSAQVKPHHCWQSAQISGQFFTHRVFFPVNLPPCCNVSYYFVFRVWFYFVMWSAFHEPVLQLSFLTVGHKVDITTLTQQQFVAVSVVQHLFLFHIFLLISKAEASLSEGLCYFSQTCLDFFRFKSCLHCLNFNVCHVHNFGDQPCLKNTEVRVLESAHLCVTCITFLRTVVVISAVTWHRVSITSWCPCGVRVKRAKFRWRKKKVIGRIRFCVNTYLLNILIHWIQSWLHCLAVDHCDALLARGGEGMEVDCCCWVLYKSWKSPSWPRHVIVVRGTHIWSVLHGHLLDMVGWQISTQQL